MAFTHLHLHTEYSLRSRRFSGGGGSPRPDRRTGRPAPRCGPAAMRELFGEDGYYLEIQDHRIPEQQAVIAGIMRLSRETGIPMASAPARRRDTAGQSPSSTASQNRRPRPSPPGAA